MQNNLPPLAEGESHSLVMRKASNLCEDLDNEEAEGLGDHADLFFQGVKVSRSRKKVNKIKIPSRRSARIQILNSRSK